MSTKSVVTLVIVAISAITLLFLNPFAWNDGGERTVVTQFNGKQIAQFTPGLYYQGFFAKSMVWPNQISVTYQNDQADYELADNGIEVGKVNIRFNDATTANVMGIVQFILPSNEKDMILLHNTHRTPQSLVQKRLAPYTKECLQSSAQLMSSEKHYGGGRAQMAQDFKDQLQSGVFLLSVKEQIIQDDIENEKKRIYLTEIQLDGNGQAKRKQSSLTEYGVTVADAAITDVDYEQKVDDKLVKIIDAATKSAISKQELMTAQQQTLTAKAKGEQALVETEYQNKLEQTKQVVEAETKVKVAEQDKLQQKIAYETALLEAKRRQALADVTAYEKKTVMIADGALEMKLKTWLESEKFKWDAFGKFQGNLTPQVISGGASAGQSTNGLMFMEMMGAQAAKNLALDLAPTNRVQRER